MCRQKEILALYPRRLRAIELYASPLNERQTEQFDLISNNMGVARRILTRCQLSAMSTRPYAGRH